MRHKTMTALAVLSAFLLLPGSGFAQGAGGAGQGMHTGAREAMRMVPANAMLEDTVSGEKMQPGATFHAKLQSKVKLENGPELPSGTELIGTVEKDDMQHGGGSTLSLRISTADLKKNGGTVPLKVTIVGILKDNSELNESPGQGLTNNSWNDGTLKVDQINVTSGVDLHSSIRSRNSGTFVSSNKSNVTLRTGTELQLAIARAMDGSQASASMH